jgi:hypothetical protein
LFSDAVSDFWSVSLALGATYQIARFINVFGGYNYFVQRAGARSTVADVNQNRVRFGLQFGYPINFDWLE